MNPTVSVHIVTYNSADDIEECLNAVLEQSHPIDQIVIVDNASSDDSADRVRSFAEQFSSKIIVVQNAINTGFAPAHNQAIGMTNSDYVLVLNPDVKLDSQYVVRLIEYMERHPEVGSATGKLVLKSSLETVDSTGLVMNGIWRAFDRGAGEQASAYMKSGEVFGVSGAAALYARRMIDDISIQGEFFDADFFAYKEDVDVAWRAEELGWRAYYCVDAFGTHERGWKKGDRKSRPIFIRKSSFINRYKMIYKNLSGVDWLKNLPKLLVYEVAIHGYILLREPKVLSAWIGFWREFPVLRRKRWEIKRKRREKGIG
ncbi:GT2 family glycosyltransferase [Paenibacillus anaericanus]|uniref:glycosyltransferase family 2 protein n=1 Tax=Paenibacillus anaericanus TaxID=170367 RepID=UPI002787332F|nr:glycosyltransferase family 2 protein [Paenibacillus anaericanus]MDQ0089977.1 GT2 family glycosyltransferase [Paenibacillus anaericanus]